MTNYTCSNKPLCCICQTTQDIYKLVKNLKCEYNIDPIMSILEQMQSDINELKLQFECACECDDNGQGNDENTEQL